jgi:hypothetical protein
MVLFHTQNSAGETPLVRRVAQRGEDSCRGLVGSSPAAIILNCTHGLPVYPDSRARAGRGVYSHELPPSLPHGQRTNCPIYNSVPAALDGTARAWRSAHPPIPEVASPGKDTAFCLAVLLMGFTPVYPNG